MTTVDDSPPLSHEQKKTIQEIIGAFLYYARIIDITMLKKIIEDLVLYKRPRPKT